MSFKYDPFGRRIQKSSAGGTTNYLYDGANVLEEVDGTGTVLARYTQGAGIDEPLAMVRGGVTNYYQADGLGSITSVRDSGGALVASYTYDTFGNLAASTGTLTNPFRYTGREFDADTGLYYYRTRYYDSGGGRFLNADAIGFLGGTNFYSYTGNGPSNFVDPSGTQAAVPIPVPAPQAVPWMIPLDGLLNCETTMTDPWGRQYWGCIDGPYTLQPPPSPATPKPPANWQSPQTSGKGGNCPKDPCDPGNFGSYAQNASELYNGGPISNAGRSLQSHSARGQGFPNVGGPPNAWNHAAQSLIEEILTNPKSRCSIGRSPRQGDYVQIRLPNGIGARWTVNGQWIGFIGP